MRGAITVLSLLLLGEVRLRDEGVHQGTIRSLNFTGDGVTCSANGLSGTCSVAAGGEGSSPLSTQGDLYTRNATVNARLPIGETGQCLKTDFAEPTRLKWGPCDAATVSFVETSVALSGGAGLFRTVVTGQGWVTGSSKVTCTVFGTTADGLTVETIAVAGLGLTVSNLSAGVGFTVNLSSPHGLEGTVRVHCTGA